MSHSASGKPPARSGRKRASNAAGCTRLQTCSPSYRKSQQPKAKRALQEIWNCCFVDREATAGRDDLAQDCDATPRPHWWCRSLCGCILLRLGNGHCFPPARRLDGQLLQKGVVSSGTLLLFHNAFLERPNPCITVLVFFSGTVMREP